MSFGQRGDRTPRNVPIPERSADMLRPTFNLRAQPTPTRPARDVIIQARRRATLDSQRPWV
jgi:hypothetical protein